MHGTGNRLARACYDYRSRRSHATAPHSNLHGKAAERQWRQLAASAGKGRRDDGWRPHGRVCTSTPYTATAKQHARRKSTKQTWGLVHHAGPQIRPSKQGPLPLCPLPSAAPPPPATSNQGPRAVASRNFGASSGRAPTTLARRSRIRKVIGALANPRTRMGPPTNLVAPHIAPLFSIWVMGRGRASVCISLILRAEQAVRVLVGSIVYEVALLAGRIWGKGRGQQRPLCC